jgi:endonuclease/exonuclease/phosphatase family metal-dependent hydrolase
MIAPDTTAPKRPLRLATWNIEWFNALFDDRGRLLEDRELSSRYQVTRADQLGAIAITLTALDADGLMVIEGPDQGSKRSTVRALENFARHFGLRARKAVHGFASETEQEIAFLYDPDRLTVSHAPVGEPAPAHGADGAPRFDTSLRADLDLDGVAEQIRFSKPPLELEVAAGNHRLRLIGVHAKSKAPHGQMSQAQFNRISIENRRKQLAECQWLRRRIDTHLDAGDSLIVMGDFNDGPGLDEYEKLFGHSGVEIAMGLDGLPDRQLYDPHACMALASRTGIQPTTARFWLAPKKRFFEALLDFIMVSPDLKALEPDWRVWHPFNDPAVMAVAELREAILTASDHFPVTIDLSLD